MRGLPAEKSMLICKSKSVIIERLAIFESKTVSRVKHFVEKTNEYMVRRNKLWKLGRLLHNFYKKEIEERLYPEVRNRRFHPWIVSASPVYETVYDITP